jgi:hypothetical protein
MSYFDIDAWVRKGSQNGNYVVFVGTRGFAELPLTSYGSKMNALKHAKQIRSACRNPVGLNRLAGRPKSK